MDESHLWYSARSRSVGRWCHTNKAVGVRREKGKDRENTHKKAERKTSTKIVNNV